MKRTIATLIAATAATLALTGCDIRITDPREPYPHCVQAPCQRG